MQCLNNLHRATRSTLDEQYLEEIDSLTAEQWATYERVIREFMVGEYQEDGWSAYIRNIMIEAEVSQQLAAQLAIVRSIAALAIAV